MTVATDLDQLAIDTIRTLSIDGVQKANSGHPGAPMGAAPMAYVLWTRFLRHAPTRPDWPDRDRFVLSAGHASMLLYSLLHLTGYDVSLDDLKSFRQWGSITPGHPEYGLTPGVEATTGPLGQGFANAVGMAIAERRLAARVQPARPRRSSTTGPTSSPPTATSRRASRRRRASLAGHLRLGQAHRPLRRQPHPARRADGDGLVARTCPRASTPTAGTPSGSRTATTSTRSRPRSRPRAADDRPSLIAVRTHIGYGSPNKQDTQKAHGAPLGPDEVRLDQGGLRLGPGPDVLRAGRGAASASARRSRRASGSSRTGRPRFAAYARRLSRTRPPSSAGAIAARLPDGWDADLTTYEAGTEVATRNASQDAIQALAPRLPELFGGAADLSESNLTDVKGERELQRRRAPAGTCASASASTRWAGSPTASPTTAGSSRTAATFLTFSDYMRGVGPARGAVRPARHLRLDPRLGRARRGRPDPPAGRALRRPPRDPEPVVRPARRRERDGGGLGARGRADATGRSPWR